MDRNGRLLGGGFGESPQVWFGFHGEYAGDGGRVVSEVRAVPRTDLEDLAGESSEEGAAVFGHACLFHGLAHAGVQPREDGAVHVDHQATGRLARPPVSTSLRTVSSSTGTASRIVGKRRTS